jgi:hypothetical protein
METSMPAFNDIQKAIEAELKTIEARAASLRAALGHLATAISPSFGEAVKGVTGTTKLPKKTAATKTKARKAAKPAAEPRTKLEIAPTKAAVKELKKTTKPIAKAAAKSAAKTKEVAAKAAIAKPAPKAVKSATKAAARPAAAGEKSARAVGSKNELPATGADFWVSQLTAEPKGAKDILSAAKASLGGKLTEKQVKMLSGRMGVYLSKLSQKGTIKSVKTEKCLAYSQV